MEKIKKNKISKDNVIKDKQNLFRIKKVVNDNTIKIIGDIFKVKKNEAITDKKLAILGTFSEM